MARILIPGREYDRQYARERYANNPHVRQRLHEKYMANREECIEKNKRYYDKHKLDPDFIERRRATARAYYYNHKEELKAKALLKNKAS